MSARLRVVSYGGGVQSTALLVLAAQRIIDFPVFLFANVGDDSEYPGTVDFVRDHATPYAAAHGIELHTVWQAYKREGVGRERSETLYRNMTRPGSKSLPIPVRGENGKPMKRSCTKTWKIEPIGQWLQAHGASADNPATVGIGISLDEIHRVNSRIAMPYEMPVYPLLDHTPPLRRDDCMRVIRDAGLPVPPKSSCWFCPFHSIGRWQDLRRDDPNLFTKAVELEQLLTNRGKDARRYWLTPTNQPLPSAVPEGVDLLPLAWEDESECDNGMCFT